jgi:hypothetical protein
VGGEHAHRQRDDRTPIEHRRREAAWLTIMSVLAERLIMLPFASGGLTIGNAVAGSPEFLYPRAESQLLVIAINVLNGEDGARCRPAGFLFELADTSPVAFGGAP